ncbi:MAG: SgcJ/EcaC family oxidoreductase [Planctomycetota bacterium]|nr:SgcJ/EcaC family oxidoreductase [Planctomycetota bacterium]MDA1215157.1 SgcJ/EcaC family oxidoreductase [Planctomycetota bacterium]
MRHRRLAWTLTLSAVSVVLLFGYSIVANTESRSVKEKSSSLDESNGESTQQIAFQDTKPKKQNSAKKPAQPTKSNEADQPEEFQIPPEEQPFWDSAQAFVDAYAKRDANAIGELFTEDAEFFDEFGERTVGREDIVAMFQAVFDEGSNSLIERIIIDRIRPISDSVVLEEGETIASETAEGPLYHSSYVALHVKGTDGIWRINTLKDRPRQTGGRHEQLDQLAWLLGEWVNEDEDSVVHTECDWSDDGNYLLRRFSMQSRDGHHIDGVQRVGWDARSKSLRSWTFDSEGGFLTGEWKRTGNQWLLTNTGVNAEGLSVSATAVYTVIDAEMVTWQLQNIIVGDRVNPAAPVVTMVRRPPEPNGSDEK